MAKIILKKRDTLSKHGYAGRYGERRRRKALRAAVDEYGHVYVIRKLNVLYVFNKYKNPPLAKTFRADMKYVQRLRCRCQRQKNHP